MRVRPVHYKELGQFLVKLRMARHWDQTEAAAFAQRKNLRPLTRQVLLRLENGQTKSPNPQALRAIATLYGVAYEQLVGLIVSERYGVTNDLPSHGSTGQQAAPQEGEPDATAETREKLLALTRERDDYRARLAQAEDAARRLVHITALGEEERATGRARAKGGRRGRKAS